MTTSGLLLSRRQTTSCQNACFENKLSMVQVDVLFDFKIVDTMVMMIKSHHKKMTQGELRNCFHLDRVEWMSYSNSSATYENED